MGLLTADDYRILEHKNYITPAIANAARLFRVHSIEGRDLVGRTGGGNYEGTSFPNWWPGTSDVTGYRLRLDHPPVDLSTGKAQYRYLSAPGQRNHFYFPLEDPKWLTDPTMPIMITEGEKKYLALHRYAQEHAIDGRPPFVPIAIAGVNAWRGRVGYGSDANGTRIEKMGVIPDFDRITWTGRPVYICFDTNVYTNYKVQSARGQLSCELERRGAVVWLIDLTPGPGINGVDDFLAIAGPEAFQKLLASPARYQWHNMLMRSDKGKILPGEENTLTALRLAPIWHGVLTFNEFSLKVETARSTPFGAGPGIWLDHWDTLTAGWLQRQGIRTARSVAGDCVRAVAPEFSYHPVLRYLDGLKWDGTGRIDDWLTLYLGVEPDEYTRAIGARWLISAVARVRQPGCQADHILVLEGIQGLGKSSAFKVLGGDWYTDDMPDLGTKDAAVSIAGVWIVELSELDAMSRAETSKVKAFISRRVDHYRPPYGRTAVDVPRQGVFGGTINSDRYLKDDTGARRFWPVKCATIRLEVLRRDRDQLWAEAAARYAQGEKWWLDTQPLIEAATEQQAERSQGDPWEQPIAKWLVSQSEVTTADVLQTAIEKDQGQWTNADEQRVSRILKSLDWEVAGRQKGTRRRFYRPKEDTRSKAFFQ